jgi:FKBP-type peptidyl-prolyl cis-trans isomerase
MPRIKMIDGKEYFYTAEEEAQADKEETEAQAEINARKEKETLKETDAKNGNKKLLDLGLTQDEVTAMTGYKPPEEL